MFKRNKKPVTIITGYLGSGKTTVMNELLRNKGSEKIAVIVNDMGSINIDASLIKSTNIAQHDVSMVELSNGCICCTLQDAFMNQINNLAENKDIEKILVEASGISDPSSIAAGFIEYKRMGLCKNVYLDSIVCVADADRIYTEFLDDLRETDSSYADLDPDIINLVIDQIEFCNTILLNKCDLLSPDKIEQVYKTIRTLQKDADIIQCIQGKVNPNRIFNDKKFDFEKIMQSSRIQEQLSRGKHEEIRDEHGITSFLYEEKKPFDYEKFIEFVEKDYPEEIIRAKGYVWFYDDDIHVQLFEQAGRNASVTIVSNWLAAFGEKERKREMREHPEIMEDWDEKYGDRFNQIVFIGKNLNRDQIISRLQTCVHEESLT